MLLQCQKQTKSISVVYRTAKGSCVEGSCFIRWPIFAMQLKVRSEYHKKGRKSTCLAFKYWYIYTVVHSPVVGRHSDEEEEKGTVLRL